MSNLVKELTRDHWSADGQGTATRKKAIGKATEAGERREERGERGARGKARGAKGLKDKGTGAEGRGERSEDGDRRSEGGGRKALSASLSTSRVMAMTSSDQSQLVSRQVGLASCSQRVGA